MLKCIFQTTGFSYLAKLILTGHLQHVWYHFLDLLKEQKLHLLSQSFLYKTTLLVEVTPVVACFYQDLRFALLVCRYASRSPLAQKVGEATLMSMVSSEMSCRTTCYR